MVADISNNNYNISTDTKKCYFSFVSVRNNATRALVALHKYFIAGFSRCVYLMFAHIKYTFRLVALMQAPPYHTREPEHVPLHIQLLFYIYLFI